MGDGAIPAPSWIHSGASITGGLDLLGLRLPVQFIGGTLFDGVTTVTPQVRYLALRAWLIDQYGKTGLPDSWKQFTEFALRMESAVVLANLLEERGIGGLIGAEQALVRLEVGSSSVSIAPLVKVPAATVYAGPSDWQQLAITKERGDAVPALVEERGVPLAKAVSSRFASIPILQKLIEDPSISEVSLDDLRELGSVARIDQVADDERQALLASILPKAPRARERARIATYTALLSLAGELNRPPKEQDLFNAACSKNRFGERALDQAADGWVAYCVRDLIAVTQEAVLSAAMTELTGNAVEGRSGAEAGALIAALMERTEEHEIAIRSLGLLRTTESMATLSFRQLRQRVEEAVTVGREMRKGISRWDSSLSETQIYQLALRSGAGALSLAVVAWIVADLRVGTSVREQGREASSLSYQGWRRQGLREVILPELQRFWREDRSVREVAAELAYRTVNQHLQIAWSRLQVDPQRDVALLTTEGDFWYARKGFSAGRTASRLSQAVGWLEQLGLIDKTGLTEDGRVVQTGALRTLAAGSPA